MRKNSVQDIILPFKKEVPVRPFVTMKDTIIHAVELMLKNDLKTIAVVRYDRPVGMVRLDDALKRLGLELGEV